MKIEKLYPVCKEYLWGGNRLKESFGKVTDATPCAESWELSLHPDGPTRLSDGRTLGELLTPQAIGRNAADFPFFPVLIKFIDAELDLSVQVHPSDAYALAEEGSFGKTEVWYILDADEDAGIYLGFSRDVSEAEYKSAIEEGRLTDLLCFRKVKAGERYFIPAGTVHAIGRGCLICEIQQNSNLTYRVYDYGRLDKDGNPRPLHVEKALAVSKLSRHDPSPVQEGVPVCSPYFHVTLEAITGERRLQSDEGSFHALTCIEGFGKIDGQPVCKGDSFFVPADYGAYTLRGEMKMILTEIRKYHLGIDLGGTFIKGGVVDDLGRILVQDKIPTEAEKGSVGVAENIAALCHSLLKRLSLSPQDVVGIGIGVPGMIDSERGEVIYSNNLGWEHFPISKAVEELTQIPVRIANDANVAALGESKFGCGKQYSTTCMLTLGTGVGGGIVLDGKLYEGNRSAGAELGHSVIVAGGEPCTCGRRGCLEAYASATALIRDTRRAMEAHPESEMWKAGGLDDVDGRTAFLYMDTDPTAREVIQNYVEKLGCGIVNLANEFRPEAVILGGGVCAEGERLLSPLREILKRELFAGSKGPEVVLLRAELGNSAGISGAAALWLPAPHRRGGE